MMNYIWSGIILISIICAAITGKIDALSASIINGAKDAVSLIISMLGMMCLWTGLMRIAEKGGLTKILAKALSPIMKRLFPDYDEGSKALTAICMNITANFLGLGNAATPFGIEAMKQMQKDRPKNERHEANNSMVMFVVINTASLQLIPSMLMILRANHGAHSPLDIMPAVWVTSLFSLIAGIIIDKALEQRDRNLQSLRRIRMT